jgi:hypothetical protein
MPQTLEETARIAQVRHSLVVFGASRRQVALVEQGVITSSTQSFRKCSASMVVVATKGYLIWSDTSWFSYLSIYGHVGTVIEFAVLYIDVTSISCCSPTVLLDCRPRLWRCSSLPQTLMPCRNGEDRKQIHPVRRRRGYALQQSAYWLSCHCQTLPPSLWNPKNSRASMAC